jgi:hypothetical protein
MGNVQIVSYCDFNFVPVLASYHFDKYALSVRTQWMTD